MRHLHLTLLSIVLSIFFFLSLSCMPSEECADCQRGRGGDGETFAYPPMWMVIISSDAPEAVRWTAEDLVFYLEEMGLAAELKEEQSAPDCSKGFGVAVFVGDGLGQAGEAANAQTWRINETRCKGGVLVELSGGGLLGRQYAGYEWLHRLGVRFFHPEEEYVPTSPSWPADPFQIERTPTFDLRSVSLHLTHPLELGDAFRLGKEEYYPEAKRYIDWIIKNGGTEGPGGVGTGDLSDYGFKRGFPHGSGISLYGQQQGGNGLLYPGEPDWEPKVAKAIDDRMGDDPGNYPSSFSFSFNPTEFTEVDDQVAVEQMTFIANHIEENYPGVKIFTTNHGTAGEPTAYYGVRYFDLPKFAPPSVGVKCHTLMFYDLFRPAPIYGNESFNFLYDFMVSEYRTRELVYFPEAAWWLTFDNNVPFYFPITIEARDRDLQNIAFMLEGKLMGHRVFGTGHEWGYWQNEYCSFRMAADLDYRYTDCLSDITGIMGDAGSEVLAILLYTIEIQERDIIYGDILRYLVGSDAETELAYSIGIVFHPLPPSPNEIMGWGIDEVDDWRNRIDPPLKRMAADYAILTARMDAVEELVPESALNFFDEIRDGLAINGIRAKHQSEVYGAAVTMRESKLRFSEELATEALSLLDSAKATTEEALGVIHGREEGYRYSPLSRSIAGGPEGTEDENWTTYDFRVHNRAHHAFFYVRIDGLVEDALMDTGDSVEIADVLIAADESLVVTITDTSLTDTSIDYGDENTEEGASFEHQYASPDFYDISVSGTSESGPFSYETTVAQLSEEYQTGFSGKVKEPSGVAIIESVLPGLTLGRVDEERLAMGFCLDESGNIKVGYWSELSSTDSGALFESAPKDLVVPVVMHSDASVMTNLVVKNAKAVLADLESPVLLSGALDTAAVIDAVVAAGGGAFDHDGATELVAGMLGYTVETLPETVPFLMEYSLKQ